MSLSWLVNYLGVDAYKWLLSNTRRFWDACGARLFQRLCCVRLCVLVYVLMAGSMYVCVYVHVWLCYAVQSCNIKEKKISFRHVVIFFRERPSTDLLINSSGHFH